ncbi:MAG: hypothetical protein ACOC97_04610 [Myxococcota bacterium]
MDNVAYDVVEGVLVLVQRRDLDGDELGELLSTSSRKGAKRVLVWVEAGSIGSKERKKIAEALSDGRIRKVSVLTDERLARGAATAVSWFGVPIRAFATDEREPALDALGLEGPARDRVSSTLDALRRSGASQSGTG